MRLASGYAFLDRDGAIETCNRLNGEIPWGSRDLRASFGLKTPKPRGRAEADIRRLAACTGSVSKLAKMAYSLELSGFTYLNVGHTSLTAETLGSLKVAGVQNWVMIHDLIPRLHPELQSPANRFDEKLDAVVRYANVIITNSDATREDVLAELSFTGSIHRIHLGTRVPSQVARPARKPHFVTVGTIEPRKNYGFLLDLWESLAKSEDPVPDLHIIGRRGWADQTLFERLNALGAEPWLHEHNDLDDTALDYLLAGARGLVFPTLAEGFGMPSVEAASMGVPVVCGDLAIHRELLGDYPVYAPLNDIYAWKKAVLDLAAAPINTNRPRLEPPSWADHFETLEDLLSKHTHFNQGP